MSPLQMWVEFQAWLDASPPAFLFLMVLPFMIATVILARDAMQVRREISRRVRASAVEPATDIGDTIAPAAATGPVDGFGAHSMPKVLIPVDGSDNALRAVRHVINQSLSRGGVETHLLHVRAPFSRHIARFTSKKIRDAHHRETAEAALAKARELLRRYSIPYAVHMDVGERAESIHRAAQRLRVDRIVMGTARKNSLTRLIQDSVTSRLLEIAHVPVEVIPGGKISKLEKYGVPAGVGTALAALTVAVAD